MILRLLNWQGIAGIAFSLVLSIALAVEKGETRHWKKQSATFERQYREEQTAFAATVANYRLAAQQARAVDQANVARVTTAQASINERTADEYESRLAAARVAAERLHHDAQAAARPRLGASASMPGLPAAADSAAQAPGEDGFSQADRLTATEQAIQLDELIKWIRAQAAVDNNPKAVASPSGD